MPTGQCQMVLLRDASVLYRTINHEQGCRSNKQNFLQSFCFPEYQQYIFVILLIVGFL